MPHTSERLHASGQQPTGTVAFLFSDIEGSTTRWERHPAAMQEALARHDALMRAAIEGRTGHIFKTMGDAFCAAFHTVPDAVAAAVDAQRAVAAASWSDVGGLAVRMAIHAGLSDEREGDYFGPTVNRVARLMSIAHGGQIILSAAAAELFKGAHATGVALKDLGQHRLRDLSSAEHVYQVVGSQLTGEFQPLRSVNALPNNLPLQLTSFVGRDREVAEIEGMLAGARLVTVVGTGGVGKTRAALQVAANVLDDIPDGAWFVDLAPVTDAALVPAALLGALGIREVPDRPPLRTALDHLAQRTALLVVDNCEHVIDAAAGAVHAILRSCANVKVLATSREGLGLEGEHAYRMPTLEVPAVGATLTFDRAKAFGAITLFAERAAAADSHFALTDENAPAVADICRRLDGIPLAIELAASRVKMFGIRELASRLDERFKLLTGGRRTALPRQQTMRALIDWSYDLLGDDERALLRRLGVFAGAWTLEAAAAVSEDPAQEWEVLDRLSALVEKSLVQVEPEAAVRRFRLLESIRQYAHDALEAAGDLAAAAAAHCRHYLEVARTVDALFVRRGESDEAFALATADVDNFRSAVAWSLGQAHDPAAGVEIAARLSILWTRSLRFEGARWLREAARSPAADAKTLARLQLALSHVVPDGVDKVARAGEAVRAYRQWDEPLALAAALSSEAEALRATGEYARAARAQAEGLALYRTHGTPKQVTSALLTLGSIETIAGNRDAARRLLEEARALNPHNGSATTNLAELAFADGRFDAAVDYAREALEYFRERHRSNACIVLCNLAAYSLALERYDEAARYAREGLTLARELRVADLVALALQHLGSVAAAAGDVTRAARLAGFADARYEELGIARDTSEEYTYRLLRAVLAAAAGPDTIAAAMAEGAAMSEERAVALAALE